MKLYWSYNSIPELANLPKENRKEVWAACHPKIFRRSIWISMIIAAVCIPLGIEIGKSYFGGIAGLIVAVIIGGIVGALIWQVQAAMAMPYIREYLNSNVKTN